MSIAQPTTEPPIPGCTPLFATETLRLADRRATERHRIPSILLMDRASLGAAVVIDAEFGGVRAALVLCGSGNNGGDGYAVARHLADAGWDVEIAIPRGETPKTPDAMTMAGSVRTLGLRPKTFSPGMLHADRIVVDALLGTGAQGAPRGSVGAVVAAVEASSARVVALDVPSGVDADTGEIAGAAIQAVRTVTFHGDKPGLHVAPGRDHAGVVTVVDIGVPRQATLTPAAWLAGADAGRVPPKPAGIDKYGAGAVLVIAGSPGLTGAGILCARATLRSGAGLTVAAVPAGVQPIYAAAITEVMSAAIPDGDGHFTHASVDAVVDQARRVNAIAIGPGLGRADATTAFVRAVLEAIDLPAVVDADALWHLASRPGWLARRTAPTVITPHAGEAANMLGQSREAVEATRLSAARKLADRTRAVTVLKGPGTIVVDHAGAIVIDSAGTKALATAGSGDVLTGIIATLLAKGMPSLQAAVTGVAVHARAGALAARRDGTIAGDLVDLLPAAIAETA